jgi:hypothetical protein
METTREVVTVGRGHESHSTEYSNRAAAFRTARTAARKIGADTMGIEASRYAVNLRTWEYVRVDKIA